jgi:hypothetical protein
MKRVIVKNERSHTRKWVVGFGYFNGVLFTLGISIDQMIITALEPVLSTFPPLVKTLLIYVPSILTLITLFAVWNKGKLMGAFAVALGFFAGYMLLTSLPGSIAMLIVAYIIGWIVFKK